MIPKALVPIRDKFLKDWSPHNVVTAEHAFHAGVAAVLSHDEVKGLITTLTLYAIQKDPAINAYAQVVLERWHSTSEYNF
jgi:hypothetical protein